jgi:DNA helicase-2/ATP-dependent DNA helicase PcrA
LIAGLNDAQRRAVTTDAAPLAILAGAGSGKTRVLTRRIARRVGEGEIDASHVLAVTFTRKAAAELRERLSTLGLSSGVHAGTFHSIAFAQLRQRWQERGVTPPSVLDRKVGFVARLTRSGSSKQRGSSTLPLDLVSEIEWAKARMIPADRYAEAATAAHRRPPIDAHEVARVFARYEEEKLARRMVDFDDLLRLATRDLRVDEGYAAARRWRYRHLFVDEFQDVNPLQFELLRAWLGDRIDLCVVGDPNQAIYSWNGADASYLAEFDRHFPGATTVELSENYRSSPQILGVANTVLATGRSTSFQLRPNRGDGPIPTVRALPDEHAEARAIARRIRDHHAPGRPWSEQAVLVRTNAQLPVIEEALRLARVPFRSRGGGRLLDQPEVRDALGALRRGPGHLAERLDEIESQLDSHSGGDGEATLNDERTANVAELVRLGREYVDLDAGGSAASFEAWLRSTLGNEEGGPATDAVDLATFHAAKGLEWSVVHLAGLEEGFVPIHHAQTEPARAEERRLLYVALTRAERELHCTWAERRAFASRSLPRRPSQYLETISLAIDLLGDGEEPIDLTSAVARQRAALRLDDGVEPARRRRPTKSSTPELDAADRELFEQLKAWRRAQARLADVPAYVIFNDATLAEVARARPASSSQLLDVNGIGAVKAQRFGEALLTIVAANPRSPSAPDGLRAAGRSGRGRAR